MAVNVSPFGPLESASRMMQSLCGYVGSVRLLFGGKCSKVELLPIHLDSRSPRQYAFRLKANSENSRGFVRAGGAPAVLRIFLARQFPKIRPTIVRPIPVQMVRLIGWKFAELVEERKPVSEVKLAPYSDARIAVHVEATGAISNAVPASVHAPSEKASLGVVVQALAKFVSGKIRFAHEAFYLCGVKSWQ